MALRYDSFAWRGGRERIARFDADGPRILIVPPFFEETNKTRRLLVETMRLFLKNGIGSALPDLPGMLESMTDFTTVTWDDWRGAIDAAAAGVGATHIASIRGGALLDDIADLPRWRLAPVEGPALLRDLVRVKLASAREAGVTTTAAEVERDALAGSASIAGYAFGTGFLAAMRDAQLSSRPARTVRLATDALPADIKVEGQPLWRRAEPGEDGALAQSIADDIAHWVATCAAG